MATKNFDEFVEKINTRQFRNMTWEEIERFCEKAIEHNITIKDILFAVALVAKGTKQTEQLLQGCCKNILKKDSTGENKCP